MKRWKGKERVHSGGRVKRRVEERERERERERKRDEVNGRTDGRRIPDKWIKRKLLNSV